MCQFGLSACLLFFVGYSLAAAGEVDTPCKISGAVVGKCKLVPDCPVALEALKKRQNHSLRRCGFQGFTEVVCCPESTERNPSEGVRYVKEDKKGTNQQSRFTKRKCEQACEELSNEVKSKVDFHIIGGVDADISDFPHMVALGYETDEGLQWNCAASIISKRYLLTAAHCVVSISKLLPKRARMGVTKLNEENPQEYIVHNITVNPDYSPRTKHNDIALIEVKGEIKFSDKVYPACLYYEHNDPFGLIVTGWGKVSIASVDDRSNVLQKATLVPMSLRECNVSILARTANSRTVISTQICAGSNISDACWGDSGGPLQIQNKEGSYSVVGIISYGAGCGGKAPGVYTRVSEYLEWIESIVWP